MHNFERDEQKKTMINYHNCWISFNKVNTNPGLPCLRHRYLTRNISWKSANEILLADVWKVPQLSSEAFKKTQLTRSKQRDKVRARFFPEKVGTFYDVFAFLEGSAFIPHVPPFAVDRVYDVNQESLQIMRWKVARQINNNMDWEQNA